MAALDLSHLSLANKEHKRDITESVSAISDGASDLYDRIYDYIGSFGQYQKLLSLVVLWGSIGMGLHSSVTIFVQPEIKNVDCSSSETKLKNSRGYFLNATEEFQLICENDWKRSFLTTIFFVGFGSGAVMVGYMCDNFGRKTTLIMGIQIGIDRILKS